VFAKIVNNNVIANNFIMSLVFLPTDNVLAF
jgi:hypothetical protein